MTSAHSSILDSVNDRIHHIAIAHEGRIIVWGGFPVAIPPRLKWKDFITNDPRYHLDQVLVHEDLRWRIQATTGEYPLAGYPQGYQAHMHAVGQLLVGKLYVFFTFNINDHEDEHGFCILDLNSWVWKKLKAKGRLYEVTSWTYGSSIYFFGTLERFTSQCHLMALDTRTNALVWPEHSGQMPQTNAYESAIAGSKVFLIGMHYQYCLDMNSLVCEKIEQTYYNWPNGRSGHSITLISNNQKMLLYGGLSYIGNERVSADCWIMDLKDLTWSRCRHLDLEPGEVRYDHRAVLEEKSGQIWIIGGRVDYKHVKKLLKLTIEPMPLLLLAVEAVARERQKLGDRLEAAKKEEEAFESQLCELPREIRKFFA